MTTTNEALSELTLCCICLDKYTRPKALPCQHCFCEKCLTRHYVAACSNADGVFYRNSTVSCPQCREKHKIPKSGISGFPDNFLMVNLMGIADAQKDKLCADCKERPSVKLCGHCNESVCADCLVVHALMSVRIESSPGEDSHGYLTMQPVNCEVEKSTDTALTSGAIASNESKSNDMTSESTSMTSELEATKPVAKSPLKRSRSASAGSAVTKIYSKLPGRMSPRDRQRVYYVRSWSEPNARTSDTMTSETETTLTSQLLAMGQAMTSKFAYVTSRFSAMTSNVTTFPSRRNTPSPTTESEQNQLPKSVNYWTKGRRKITMIGQTEKHKLLKPAGVAYNAIKDQIYVTDSKHRVMVYGSDGQKGRVFYTDLREPWDVAVTTDGKHVFIATTESLLKITTSGKLEKTFTTFSGEDFKFCSSVFCHQDYTLLVVNKCVVIFDKDDEEIRSFGRNHLELPVSLSVSEDCKIHVTDMKSSSVVVFSWEGLYLETLFSLSVRGNISGIALDGDGNVCVARFLSSRIDVYNSQKELITSIGQKGEKWPGQLKEPQGLCLCPDGRLVIVDCGNNRIQIF